MLKSLLNLFIDSLFPKKALDAKIKLIDFDFMQKNFPKPHAISIKKAFSIYSYKDERVKHFIWNIKYKKDSHSADLAAIATKWKIEQLFGRNSLILIPIPSSRLRKNERGFNQIEYTLDKMQKLKGSENIIVTKLLKRKTHLDSQTKKNREDRLASVDLFEIDKEAMQVLPQNFSQNTFIIIDDVLTTGQTMQQAIKTIESSGIRDVYGVTFAH